MMESLIPYEYSFERVPLVNYSSYINDTYVPSMFVELATQICSTDIHDPLYFEAVITNPVYLFILGIIILIFLGIGLCCNCTKKCSPTLEKPHSTKVSLIPLCIFLFLLFLTTNYLYIGYDGIAGQIVALQSSLDVVSDQYIGLKNIARQLETNNDYIVDVCFNSTNFTCTSDIVSSIGYVVNTTSLYAHDVVLVPGTMDDYR